MSSLARRRVLILSIWAIALIAWFVSRNRSGLGTIEAAQRLVDEVDDLVWAPLLFVVAYLLRPLLLVPASLMTVAAGILFGATAGTILVILAANGSAMVAYAVGRSLAGNGDESGDDESDGDERIGLVSRWGRRLRTRSFETVFVMRLLFLPYDLVNYASGALRVRPAAFLLATVLGTLPGTLSFVLLGASLERLDEGIDGIDPWAVGASVVIFVVSMVIAAILRRRTPSGDAATPSISHDPTPAS